MNFLDTYGLTGTGTSTPSPSEQRQPEQSLNEEVSQVIGQLGRFWGGFRKQSEVAIATARGGLTQVVSQAQRELEKLTTAETPAEPSQVEGQTKTSPEHEEEESDAEQSADTPTAETVRSASTEPTDGADASASSPTTQSFFSRLQSSIPPNIVSAVQAQLPESLKNAQNIDFTQLGNTLSREIQRMHGVTRTQAEEYVHKSEALLREAMKEAGEVLRESVKVIPPEEAGSTDAPGVIWDGSDIWMLPGLVSNSGGSTNASSTSKGKGKEVDSGPSSARQSEDSRRVVATRAESLLKQLRSNPEIIKLDPAVDTSKDAYMAWADMSEASGEGFGSKVWGERVAEALSDPTLQDTLDALVPSYMPEEVFWVRYFFRVHQIEVEENRRKALLQATAENEEDFSWEDDEDESTSASDRKETASQHTLAPPRTTSASDVLSLPSSHAQSPRESSDESYDVVSRNASNAGDTGVVAGEGNEEEEDEDEDEAEDEDEDDDDDEEDEDEDEDEEDGESEGEKGEEGEEEEGEEGEEEGSKEEDSDWE